MALIEDVVDDQHDAAGDFRGGKSFPLDAAADRGVAVAGQVYVIEIEREFEQRQQLPGEYDGTAHHAQHQRVRGGEHR